MKKSKKDKKVMLSASGSSVSESQTPLVKKARANAEEQGSAPEGNGQMPDPEELKDNEANQEETRLSGYDLKEK